MKTRQKPDLRSTPFAGSETMKTRTSGWESRSTTSPNLPTRTPTTSCYQTKASSTTPTSLSSGKKTTWALTIPIIRTQKEGALCYMTNIIKCRPLNVVIPVMDCVYMKSAKKKMRMKMRMKLRVRTRQTPNLKIPAQTCSFSRFLWLAASSRLSMRSSELVFKLARLRGNSLIEFAPKILWCCWWFFKKIVFIVSMNTI